MAQEAEGKVCRATTIARAGVSIVAFCISGRDMRQYGITVSQQLTSLFCYVLRVLSGFGGLTCCQVVSTRDPEVSFIKGGQPSFNRPAQGCSLKQKTASEESVVDKMRRVVFLSAWTGLLPNSDAKSVPPIPGHAYML
jgi:hypothetical protein